jgi:CRP-like cAMP-binding protein
MAQPSRAGTNRPPQLTCRTCPTARSAQWRALTPAELDELDRAKITTVYDPGKMVFQQDSVCRGVYCIAAGSIVTRRMDALGNSVLIGLTYTGQTFGYRSFYNNRHHADQAETLESSTICMVPVAAVERLVTESPALSGEFTRSLASDVKQLEEVMLERTGLPVRARVANLLQMLLDRFGEGQASGQIVLRLPFNRQQMADLLGIQRETVTRTLNALQSDGVLTHTGRTVVVHDLDRLLDELEGQ